MPTFEDEAFAFGPTRSGLGLRMRSNATNLAGLLSQLEWSFRVTIQPRSDLDEDDAKYFDVRPDPPPPPPPPRTRFQPRPQHDPLPCASTAVISARLARAADLPSLLELFAVSEVSPVVQPLERAEAVWQETLARQGVYVFVSEEGMRVAATCMLVTAPNLLRQGRCHGFLENVVTHPELRGLGHGSAVVRAALTQAWAADCHHVLLQSGRADPRVHRFYERLGFVPGRRTAYFALKT